MAALSNKLDGWDFRMGKNTKLNLTELLSFSEGSSLRDKGICNAKQSSSSQKKTVTLRGLGGSKSRPHPPARPGVGGWGRPSRASGSAREPVAGPGSKSYDILSGQLGAGCPGILAPSQPFKAKLCWALPASLQNGPTVGCVCARSQEGAERTDSPPPPPSRYPSGHLQVGALHPASFPQAQISQITQSCLVQTCPRHA